MAGEILTKLKIITLRQKYFRCQLVIHICYFQCDLYIVMSSDHICGQECYYILLVGLYIHVVCFWNLNLTEIQTLNFRN
jgi:hypothetical protein